MANELPPRPSVAPTEPMPTGINPTPPKLDPKTGVPLGRGGISDQTTQPVPSGARTTGPEELHPPTANNGGMMGNIPYPPQMQRASEPTGVVGDRLRPETYAELKKRGGG
jgi:hypothetical protein